MRPSLAGLPFGEDQRKVPWPCMPASFASMKLESDSSHLGNPRRFIQIEKCSSRAGPEDGLTGLRPVGHYLIRLVEAPGKRQRIPEIYKHLGLPILFSLLGRMIGLAPQLLQCEAYN